MKELIHVRVDQDAIFDERLRPGELVPVEIGKKPRKGDLVAVVYLEPYAGKNKNRGAILGVCGLLAKTSEKRKQCPKQ